MKPVRCFRCLCVKTFSRSVYYSARAAGNLKKYVQKQRQNKSDLQTQNPKEFWSEINKLGPRQPRKNIDCVYTCTGDGNITYNSQEILRKWKSDFSTLFNNSNGNYEDNFMLSLSCWQWNKMPCRCHLLHKKKQIHGSGTEIKRIIQFF